MRLHRLILLIGIAVLFVSCSPANGTTALPTIAVIPNTLSTTPPPNTEPSPLPTFTLVPPISTLQVELTTAFSSPSSEVTREATVQSGLLKLKMIGTLSPSELEYSHQLILDRVEGDVKSALASSIVSHEMQIEGNDVEGYLQAVPFQSGSFYIAYNYISNRLTKDNYLSKLPYALCGLREAGFTNISGSIHVSLVSKTSKATLATTNTCINSDAVSQINCDNPSRTNISVLMSSATKCEIGQ